MTQEINKAGNIIKQVEMATVFDSREINALYVNNVGVQIEYTDFSKRWIGKKSYRNKL